MLFDWKCLPRPPLEDKRLYVKSIRLQRIPSVNRQAFKDIFEHFFEDPARDPRENIFRENNIGVDQAYNLRRLSGGTNLSRGCYYTLCDGDGGYSAQTLAMELLAYATTDGEFKFQIYDLNDPWADTIYGQLDMPIRRQVDAHDRKVLLIVREPVAFSPDVHSEAEFDPYALHTHLVLPYEVETLQAVNVLDLRERHAMEWLLHLLWEYFPGVVFMEGEKMPYTESLDATGGRGPLVMYSDITHSFADLPNLLEEASLLNVGLKDLSGHEWPMYHFLEYIRHRALGGTPIDDLIGLCIQQMGAETLVYPSARHDSLVRYRDGSIDYWLGFNLIDYRDRPTDHPRTRLYIIQNPAFWQGLEGALELLRPQANPYAVADWAVHGTAQLTRSHHLRMTWMKRLQVLEGLSLPEPIIVERQQWRGHDGRRWRRKPREFKEVEDLWLSLVSGEIELNGMLVKSVRDPQTLGMTLGTYLADVSKSLDLCGGRYVRATPPWKLGHGGETLA